jgi:hypothetical protein
MYTASSVLPDAVAELVMISAYDRNSPEGFGFFGLLSIPDERKDPRPGVSPDHQRRCPHPA